MKTLLMIGNSFADDAAAFLHQISLGGEEVVVGVLYIGGCPLSKHGHNLKEELPAYEYRENGITKKQGVTIQEIVESRDWDAVSFQQVSYLSGKYESFQPYLNHLIAYIKEKLPKTKLFLYKTWSYEEGFDNENFDHYGRDSDFMSSCIDEAFAKAKEETGIEDVVDANGLVRLARLVLGGSFNRDGFHLNEKGRYLVGALWANTLGGKPSSVYLPTQRTYPEPGDLPTSMECGLLLELASEFTKRKTHS